jgi:hypothetical protein
MGAFVGERNLDVIKMHGTVIKKTQNFAINLQQFCNIYETFLQLSVLLTVGKDQNVYVLLKVSLRAGWSQCSEEIQQCAEDMDLRTGIWSTEGICKIFFFVYLILASPKTPFVFFF